MYEIAHIHGTYLCCLVLMQMKNIPAVVGKRAVPKGFQTGLGHGKLSPEQRQRCILLHLFPVRRQIPGGDVYVFQQRLQHTAGRRVRQNGKQLARRLPAPDHLQCIRPGDIYYLGGRQKMQDSCNA